MAHRQQARPPACRSPPRPSVALATLRCFRSELLQAAVSGAQRAQQLYRAKADEVRRLKAALRQRGEDEAHANVTTTGIRLNDRVLFVRSAGAAGRSERPYLAVPVSLNGDLSPQPPGGRRGGRAD